MADAGLSANTELRYLAVQGALHLLFHVPSLRDAACWPLAVLAEYLPLSFSLVARMRFSFFSLF